MKSFGERSRPRLLVVAFDEATRDSMAKTLATQYVTVDTRGDLAKVRQGDWDAVIVFGEQRDVDPSINRIEFSDAGFANVRDSASETIRIGKSGTTVATIFDVVDDVPEPIAQLLETTVVPALGGRPTNVAFGVNFATQRGPEFIWQERSESFRPVMADRDGHVVVARIVHWDTKREWWWFPRWTESPERLVLAILDLWAAAEPEIFSTASGFEDFEWRTAGERAQLTRIDELDAALAAYAARNRREREVLSGDLESEESAADSGLRRLLTAQGDELVGAVLLALEVLGFEVEDVDVSAVRGDKREDLRVKDPDDAEWVAIAEVRGYKRGAQLNDLLRLGRFRRRFRDEFGREPSAVWYVANHFLSEAPGGRDKPLAPNVNEVATFGEDDGVVIDSRELFQLVVQVQEGTTTQAEARALLRTARGRPSLESAT